MTEEEALAWVNAHVDVSRGTLLRQFVDLLVDESARQNLVSATSMDHLWARHIVDSAQLLALGEATSGAWVDIGTGAGFPGAVVAILSDRPVVLIEPRRKRAAFLQHATMALGISDRVTVFCGRAETYDGKAGVISARAVAALSDLLAVGAHLSTAKTTWILPKGPRALEEVAEARHSWHGVFHVEQSITDPQSLIIIAKGVSRR